MHEFVSSDEIVKQINAECQSAEIGCLDCKKMLAKNVSALLEPMQNRRAELVKDPDYISQVLHNGGQCARKIIQQTVGEVRERMGLRMF